MKINNRRELQKITINYSADIDYKDLQTIYKKTVFIFWQSIQHYRQVIQWDLEKICLILIKMTVTDQIKILDSKIMRNEAQYDLDRKAAKISELSSNDLDKYEYLTGEDPGLKPSTVEQARTEYSPISKFFNKGLKEEDKKEGLLKGLKNMEDKYEKSLKAVKNKTQNIKEVTDFVEESLSLEAKGLIEEIKLLKDVD